MRKRAIEQRLSGLAPFANPRADLEQYQTPADVAAHLVHRATLHGDLHRQVVDLGTGTGVLAIGAALVGAPVVGIEIDADALSIARGNGDRAGVRVDWVHGDARVAPLCCDDVTVLMNPPFGAQVGSRGADAEFLATANDVAAVSYSIHNEGSREFVESFAADEDATVTHAFRARIDVDRQFSFHSEDRRTVPAELFRIEWS